jgi:antitoxin HigA-1
VAIKMFKCAGTEALFRLRRVARSGNIWHPALRIGEILAGRRTIATDTDLRLCQYFGLLDGWCLRLQADYDTGVAKAILAKTPAKIKPWAQTAEDAARAH